uniref:FKBP-type peptidyl-prolyl cis-trans isomerase N-terminal domain-containing protein n=1 Tax=Psychrobacter sp. TaxID=56811 RepID=UPI00159B020B|nr:FKBP-type peptidyl-prolyl cis-trans isomerase [Psychrobacter sp.]QJS05079.1 peptidyl-prolyl cis-trans isomerase [Psychrobacter sp.]
MKKNAILTVSTFVITILLIIGCRPSNAHEVTITKSIEVTVQSLVPEKVGYSLGFMMAEGNKDAVEDLNLDAFEKGFRDGYQGKKPALTQEHMQDVMMNYQKDQEEKELKKIQTKAIENKSKGSEFLAKNGKKIGVQTTASGLQYKIITAGKGKTPKATDVVKINYEGKLLDGRIFDSSLERSKPSEFSLDEVLAGLNEGLQLMKEGSKYEFYIPSNIAYGDEDNYIIEPGSTLIFNVELLKIKAIS